jgi:hypothetical protein
MSGPKEPYTPGAEGLNSFLPTSLRTGIVNTFGPNLARVVVGKTAIADVVHNGDVFKIASDPNTRSKSIFQIQNKDYILSCNNNEFLSNEWYYSKHTGFRIVLNKIKKDNTFSYLNVQDIFSNKYGIELVELKDDHIDKYPIFKFFKENEIYEINGKKWFYLTAVNCSSEIDNICVKAHINYWELKDEYDKIKNSQGSTLIPELKQKVENIINFYNNATFKAVSSTAGGRRKTRRSRRGRRQKKTRRNSRR